MSIALAIISSKNVVVASDGRITEYGCILSDCFDKTFAIPEKHILGAFTGLMQFSGKTVSEHINEIVKNKCKNLSSMVKMIDIIAKSFSERMKNINEKEVSFYHRIIDLIIADKNVIYGGRFKPNEDNKEICYCLDTYLCCTIGDDNAREEVSETLKANANRFNAMQTESLISFAKKAIQKGIDNSGSIEQNQKIKACGGKPFSRHM